MSIKNNLVKIAEKITGRKCCRCHYNVDGRCCHPDGNTFMRCWQSITRPGYAKRVYFPSKMVSAAELRKQETQETGDLTEEELYELGKIVESLQEASDTAKDAGLLED